MLRLTLATFFSALLLNLSAWGQTHPQISVETDPSTFALGGYAAHIRIKPGNSGHLVLGAGTYALDFPDFMVGLNPNNKDEGWKVRITEAYSLFGEYYLSQAGKGWFLGLQAGMQHYRIRNENSGGTQTTYWNTLLMPSVGYTWQPFKFPLYLKPWAGIGYAHKVQGSSEIAGRSYEVSPLVPFVTLHVGYRLDL